MSDEVEPGASLELSLVGQDGEGNRLTLVGEVQVFGSDGPSSVAEKGFEGNAVESLVLGGKMSEDASGTGTLFPSFPSSGTTERLLFGDMLLSVFGEIRRVGPTPRYAVAKQDLERATDQ